MTTLLADLVLVDMVGRRQTLTRDHYVAILFREEALITSGGLVRDGLSQRTHMQLRSEEATLGA